MNHLQACSRIALVASLFLLAITSCTTPPKPGIPLTREEKDALAATARPPQAFGLTVKETDRGIVLTGGNRVLGGSLDRVDMEEGSGVVVRLRPGDPIEFNALVDTSSPDCWIDPLTAMRIGFRLVSGTLEVMPAHVWDASPGWQGLAPSLRVGKLRVNNPVMAMRLEKGTLGMLQRTTQNVNRAGAVLGVNFLRPFNFIQLDWAKRQAVFSATIPFKPTPELMMADLPLGDLDGALGCRGRIDGRDMDFIIDTAGDFELATHEAWESPVRQLTLGELVLRNVNVSSAYALQLGHLNVPRIGLGILTRYRVTFDFVAGRLYIERP
jgi:hypothetical protein